MTKKGINWYMGVHIPDAYEKLGYTSFQFLASLKICVLVWETPSCVAVAEF